MVKKFLSPKRRMRSKGPVSTKRLKAAAKKSPSDSGSSRSGLSLKTPSPILRKPGGSSSKDSNPQRRLSFSGADEEVFEGTPPRKPHKKAESPMTESKADQILKDLSAEAAAEEPNETSSEAL